jgi:hypothetical protein
LLRVKTPARLALAALADLPHKGEVKTTRAREPVLFFPQEGRDREIDVEAALAIFTEL